jgi:AcrR family transcriptional regulator
MTDTAQVPSEERILQAAIAGLAEMDPAALTIKRICEAADVTPPTVYYHFGSKDGVVAAAIERLVDDWIRLMDQGVSREGSLQEALAQAAVWWEMMIRAPQRPLAVFVWVLLLAGGSSEQSREALIRARDRSHERVAEAILTYIDDREQATWLAALMVDAVVAAGLEYHLDGDEAALRRRLETMTGMVRLAAGL